MRDLRPPAYMLDADSVAGLLKRSDAALTRRVTQENVGSVCVSAITHSELMFGVTMTRRSEPNQAALDLFLRHVVVLEYPAEAGAHYAAIREALTWREEMIGAHDLLIAAHARCVGLTLVTERTREFGRVPGLEIVDWAGRVRQ